VTNRRMLSFTSVKFRLSGPSNLFMPEWVALRPWRGNPWRQADSSVTICLVSALLSLYNGVTYDIVGG